MIIKKSRLNESYKKFCFNRELDPLDEESTKEFMQWYMTKNNLTHVKDTGDSFHFLKAFKR